MIDIEEINTALSFDILNFNELRKEDFIVGEFINYDPDIAEDKIDRLFDRFYTGNKSRNDRNTGLGLFIVKSLVEKLGYEIKAEIVHGMLNINIIFKIGERFY